MKTYLPAIAAAALLLSAPAAMAQAQGTTSGPASGSPATLGTGGTTPVTPHQSESLRDKGGAALKDEHQGQTGGTTKKAAERGTEAGPAPKPPQ